MNESRFVMRIDRVTAERLESLVKREGKSQAAVLRSLINQAAGAKHEQQAAEHHRESLEMAIH